MCVLIHTLILLAIVLHTALLVRNYMKRRGKLQWKNISPLILSTINQEGSSFCEARCLYKFGASLLRKKI